MLKFIYKTLLISLLSCSLMLVDFNSKGLVIQSAQAETVKTEGVKDSDMMATLTMTAVGLLASRLYQCKLTTDMMIAAAGGAAFLAGEVLATIKLKKVMKDLETEITRDDKGNIDQKQIETLQKLKQSYEEAKKTAGTKKTLQQASAAAFLAAAAVAYSLYASETAAQQSCTSSLASAATSCAKLAASYASSTTLSYLAPPTASGGTTAATAGASELAQFLDSQTPSPSAFMFAKDKATNAAQIPTRAAAAAQCPAVGAAHTVCTTGEGIMMTTRGVCMVPPAIAKVPGVIGNRLYANAYYTPIHEGNMLANIFKAVFMPEARADLFSPLGIVSSAAITFVLMTSKTLGVQIDTFLFSPMNRAIVWGVLAGLAFAASTSTDNVIKKIESNIQKIDTILNAMYSLSNGTSTGQTVVKPPQTPQTIAKPGGGFNANNNNYDDVNLSDGANGGSLPCFTGGDSVNCKSFQDMNKDLPSFKALDVESQKQIEGILKTANGFNGTSKITKGTLDGAASLAGSANAMRGAMDKAKGKVSDQLKAVKSKINLDAKEKAVAAGFDKAIRDSLKKSNSSPSDMVASIYGSRAYAGNGSSSGSGEGSEDETLKKGVATANIIDLNAGTSATAPGMDAGLAGIGGGGVQSATPEELAAYNSATKSTPLDAYDLQESEISKDSSASIFELISNRYQRTGYQRLFEKVKAKEPAATPVKN